MDTATKIEMKKVDDSFEIIHQFHSYLEKKTAKSNLKVIRFILSIEKNNDLLHHRFASKLERFDECQQLLYENEKATCEVESTTEDEIPECTRQIGGWRNPSIDLPRVRVEHDLPEEEKQCTYRHDLIRVGEEYTSSKTRSHSNFNPGKRN